MRQLSLAELQRLPLGVNRILIRAFLAGMNDPTGANWGPWLASVFPFPQDPQVVRRLRQEVVDSLPGG